MQANFIWERGKSSILVVQQGCYRIDFAVFARKRPTVQLVVNNEPLISAMGSGMNSQLYMAPKSGATGCFFS